MLIDLRTELNVYTRVKDSSGILSLTSLKSLPMSLMKPSKAHSVLLPTCFGNSPGFSGGCKTTVNMEFVSDPQRLARRLMSYQDSGCVGAVDSNRMNENITNMGRQLIVAGCGFTMQCRRVGLNNGHSIER